MSFDNFISYLQQILSMVDAENEHSIALAKAALAATITLAKYSKKVDITTSFAMSRASHLFEYFVENADEFRGIPGDYAGNKHKRMKLSQLLQPGC